MSITSKLRDTSIYRFVIPRAGKMFITNIARDNRALAFTINKGYFETDTLDDLLDIMENCNLEGFKFIGNVDKVDTGTSVVYRQRIYFNNFKDMIAFSKRFGVKTIIPDSFNIEIDCVTNILSTIPVIEKYAKAQNELIHTWLTNTLIVNLHFLLEYTELDSNLNDKVDAILKNRKGYMDRAPFLFSHYDINTNNSAIFLHLQNCLDERVFTIQIHTSDINFGFTTKNIKADRKGGII